MKKILILSLFICLTFCFSACTKRDKLIDNTMILQIEPADDISLGVGETCSLRAIVRNIKMEEVKESVKWSVSPSDLGSFDSVSSKNTAFMAETGGEGKISLSCQGVTVSVNITIS